VNWEDVVAPDNVSDNDEVIFNDDLLAIPKDRDQIDKRFTSIAHVLDDNKLLAYFSHFNKLAGDAKQSSRNCGAGAIMLGTAAILLAGFEILMDHYVILSPTDVHDSLANVLLFIALVAVVCGLLSPLVGWMGVLLGERKRRWLHNRFMSETTRQFHFQSMIARLPEILASLQGEDEQAKARAREIFIAKRDEWWFAFQAAFKGRIGIMFEYVIDLSEEDGWRHDRKELPDLGGDHPELEPLFAAYRMLRFEHQRNYAEYKLQRERGTFISSFPRQQAAVLRALSTWAIGALLTIHILFFGIIVAIAIASILKSGGHDVFSAVFSQYSGIINAAIIFVPLTVLVTHAFSNGLMPEWEIDRYERYRAGIDSALKQFDAGRTQAEKLVAMRHLEHLAFEEMRDFLRVNNRALFVI